MGWTVDEWMDIEVNKEVIKSDGWADKQKKGEKQEWMEEEREVWRGED